MIMATPEFLNENALKELERVEGTGYVVTAQNGNSVFITDEVLMVMLQEIKTRE
jgi:hypothetical protein